MTGAQALGELVFYDGADRPRCEAPTTLAFTFPSSQVVWVCTSQFDAMARLDPRVAEAALSHESLHSLGLGENPPASATITSRVMSRCRN